MYSCVYVDVCVRKRESIMTITAVVDYLLLSRTEGTRQDQKAGDGLGTKGLLYTTHGSICIN